MIGYLVMWKNKLMIQRLECDYTIKYHINREILFYLFNSYVCALMLRVTHMSCFHLIAGSTGKGDANAPQVP